MEFTNEIFFNKPLTAESTVIITYCGKLYREHSKEVTIVYGYGDNWDYTESSPMIEKDNGFEITLTIKNYNTFNFCFTNNYNIWDNNFGFNYISPILPKKEDLTVSEESKQYNNSQEENYESDDTLSELNDLSNPESDISSLITTEIPEEIENEQTESEENNQSQIVTKTEYENTEIINNNTESDEDIESAFSALLDSLFDDIQKNKESVDVSNLSVFGLQSVDEIKEEDTIDCDEIFNDFFEELTSNTSEEEPKSIENTITEEVPESETEKNFMETDIEELDGLMDNLLTSISSTEPTENSNQVLSSNDLSNEKIGTLAVQQNEDWVDKIINISYSLTKKITKACRKLGNLIKLKAKEFGIIEQNK